MHSFTASDQCASTAKKEEECIPKERAAARWSILRNALLQRSQGPAGKHSIHRFSGYKLLERRAVKVDEVMLSSRLTQAQWDSQQSVENNLEQLSVVCLATAALYPKGKCLTVINVPCGNSWINALKERCRPSVSLLLVEETNPTTITILIQEASTATKYAIYEYVLDDRHSIWTREPMENRLSLADLVSHRKTGVDNTGNVCVWDSELSLAYLLYNHYTDFPFASKSSPRRILELGTGMAGLSAIALGLRVLLLERSDAQPVVHVTLTDGHPDGVQNNRVNKFLSQMFSASDDHHAYNRLDISTKVLLWTTKLEPCICPPQDLVLVSDCTHFQMFHAALAITCLQSLRVGGIAIFCQPTRGNSLENFCTLWKASSALVELDWLSHPVIEKQDSNALEQYPTLYDRDLHCPKVLLIRKLRDMTETDCLTFVQHQAIRL